MIFHGIEVVLRRARDGAFVFPKGHIEEGETREETAMREALEETGLMTRIIAPLGTQLFPYKQKMRHATYFLMAVTEETEDWQLHRDKDTFLFSPADAAAKLSHDESRELLRRALARRMRTED